MDDLLLVHVLETSDETGYEEAGRHLVKLSVSANVVAEITARQVVHHEVQILSVLEGVVHVDDVYVVELS